MRRPRPSTPASRRRFPCPPRARLRALLAWPLTAAAVASASACDIVDLEGVFPESGDGVGCAGDPGMGGEWAGSLGPQSLRVSLTQRCDTVIGFLVASYAWRVEGTWRWGELDGTVRFLSTAHSALDFRGCASIQDECALILGGDAWHPRYVPGPEAWAWNSPVELRAVVRSGSHLGGFARGSWVPVADTTTFHGQFGGTPFTLVKP